MTPQLWVSPIYINIFMNLAILSELLGLFSHFFLLSQAILKPNRPSNSGKIAKFMKILIQIGDSQSYGVII